MSRKGFVCEVLHLPWGGQLLRRASSCGQHALAIAASDAIPAAAAAASSSQHLSEL
jgi:hypothetical protein